MPDRTLKLEDVAKVVTKWRENESAQMERDRRAGRAIAGATASGEVYAYDRVLALIRQPGRKM